ncbi:hypothetical protein GCM10009836_59930 [Pseudonocardia ailaonensis]|uniref:Uncharacterized protein n=1 Tax=Pseudonocardia ailaonensis TaxID=367279 RepID=A0ABN2NIW9_9PSEU
MTGDATDDGRTGGVTGWGWNAREPYAAPRYLARTHRPAEPRPGLFALLRSLFTRHR